MQQAEQRYEEHPHHNEPRATSDQAWRNRVSNFLLHASSHSETVTVQVDTPPVGVFIDSGVWGQDPIHVQNT